MNREKIMTEFSSLANAFTAKATQIPNKTAIFYQDAQTWQTLTYQQLYHLAQNIAAYLLDIGVKQNDKIAISMENGPQWCGAYLAIMYMGAIAVPIDPQITAKDLQHIIQDATVKCVFTSQQYVHLFAAFATLKIIQIDEHLFNLTPPAKFIESPSNQNNIASIVYTSGTTGVPKGVVLSHSNFYANFQSADKIKILTDQHNFLGILPLHHTFPFMVTFLIPMLSGNAVTFLNNLRGDEILKCMRETGITILVAVPQFYELFYTKIASQFAEISFLIRHSLFAILSLSNKIRKFTNFNFAKLILAKLHKQFGNKLDFFVSGGAKLDIKVGTYLTKLGFTIIEGYGLTETSPIVTFNADYIHHPGSAGIPVPDVEVKIADPDQNGAGEIAIRGPNVMRGYYHLDIETAEILKDNWFYSGDLGRLDKDGYLYITGRKKEIIVLASGKNIVPEEVEKYYLQSPFIKELCVLDVQEKGQEKLVAVILPDFESFQRKNITSIFDTIHSELERLSRNYPPYKRIMGFRLIKEELPKTRLGKLKRYLIAENYKLSANQEPQTQKEPSAEDAAILVTPIGKKITKILQNFLKEKKEINANDHLELDLGIDSLKRVELFAVLEKNFAITIPEHLIATIFQVKELIIEISKLLDTNIGAQVTEEVEFSWTAVLQEPPPPEVVEKIEITPSLQTKITKSALDWLPAIAFKLFWRTKVVGAENLRCNDNEVFILCANHVSFLDGFAIAGSMPKAIKQKLFFLGNRDYFEVPIIRHLIKALKVIPIDPVLQLTNAMQASAYVLQNKQFICIFPEGTRSSDGSVKEFKKGVGILAKELNVKLVPVYIDGTFSIWPRPRKFPKLLGKITIKIGLPYSPTELITKEYSNPDDTYEAIAAGIREKVIALNI
jgi:long-chain acyl-CoA synthetase